MNEGSKIEISKSALISLKAELLRKHDEVSNAKRDSKNQIENFKPTSKFAKVNSEMKDEKKSDSYSKNAEDCEMLRKSREALEKKSIIYEHLSQSTSNQDNSEHYLVQFDKKKKDIEYKSHKTLEHYDVQLNDEQNDLSESDDYSSDEEWVDYVDCFGRTRRCHTSDLEYIKRRDERLKKDVNVPASKEAVHKTWIKEGEEDTTKAELESPDAYKEQLRKQWEQKEQELLKKDNVHYEDVLFNEARSHGVGYFALSSDAVERAKQQSELAATRTQTEKAQNKAAEARRKREEALQARVKAARARQRARAGLPPEEEEPKPSITTLLLDFVEKQKDISAAKAAVEARQKREEKEKEAQKEREKMIREWDLGKEGLNPSFVQMTQEQWVDKKRKERNEEFAPPQSLNAKCKVIDNREFDGKGYFTDNVGNIEDANQFCTSFKGKRKHYYDPTVNKSNTTFEPTLIRNECSDDEDLPKSDNTTKSHMTGVEIAPPATYEYYGPSEKRRKNPESCSNVSEAFAQGLKYLDEKKAKRKKPSF